MGCAVAAWELALVSWLFWSHGSRKARWTIVWTFAAFLGLSFNRYLFNPGSCACLGAFTPPPIWMLLINCLLFGLYSADSLRRDGFIAGRSVTRFQAVWIAVLSVVALVNLRNHNPALSHEAIKVQWTDAESVTTIKAGTITAWNIKLDNTSSQNATLAQLRSSCDCLQASFFEGRSVPAGGQLKIGLTLDLSTNASFRGHLRASVQLGVQTDKLTWLTIERDCKVE